MKNYSAEFKDQSMLPGKYYWLVITVILWDDNLFSAATWMNYLANFLISFQLHQLTTAVLHHLSLVCLFLKLASPMHTKQI